MIPRLSVALYMRLFHLLCCTDPIVLNTCTVSHMAEESLENLVCSTMVAIKTALALNKIISRDAKMRNGYDLLWIKPCKLLSTRSRLCYRAGLCQTLWHR